MRPGNQFVLVLALLLTLSTLAFSFNVSAYLYANENASAVVSQALPGGANVSYTLYTISGQPSLLTANDAVLTDQATIATILHNSFSSELMPSQDELAAMQAQFKLYNDSRNAKIGLAFTGIENTCLQDTWLNSYPCNDTNSCDNTANAVCSNFGEGCDPSILAPATLDYALRVQAINQSAATIYSDLFGLTIDNIALRISDMQTQISILQTQSAALAQNKLRNPDPGDSCPDCIGVCPSTHLQVDALTNLSSSLSSISARLGPALSVDSIAREISASTADRIAYSQASAQAAVWEPQWTAFKANYSSLRDNASTLAIYISDPNFTASYNSFQAAWAAMEKHVASRNYTNVEKDLAAAQSSVPVLQAYLISGSKPYTDALLAQNHVGDALKEARWSVSINDKTAVAAYNALVVRKNAIDATFTPPMSASQYKALTANYSALYGAVNTFLDSQGQTTGAAGNLGEAFGQASVNGVFSLTDALITLPPATRDQVAPIIPPIVLILSDLAAISIALLVFIGGLFYLRPLFRTRAALGVWVSALFIFLFVLGLGSVGLFALINQSAASGNLGDWLHLLSASRHSYVALDQTNAPDDALAAMTNCSANITSQLKARFNASYNVTTFTYSGTSCTLLGHSLTLAQCVNQTNNEPILYLHYNATSRAPRFSVVFGKQADAWYNTADYNKCEIGDVLN